MNSSEPDVAEPGPSAAPRANQAGHGSGDQESRQYCDKHPHHRPQRRSARADQILSPEGRDLKVGSAPNRTTFSPCAAASWSLRGGVSRRAQATGPGTRPRAVHRKADRRAVHAGVARLRVTRKFGVPEHFSSGRSSLRVPLAVTWRDRRMRPTVGFRSIAGTSLAQPPGSQPGREVPDDHCRPIHRARRDPARLHRRRTARPRRVPGRIPRPDQGGLRTRPAPVHHLVPCSFPAPVRGPPRRHRVLRPRPGSQGPGPATITRRR